MSDQQQKYWHIRKIAFSKKSGKYSIHLECGRPVVVDEEGLEEIKRAFRCTESSLEGAPYPHVSGSCRRDFEVFVASNNE